jgi:hypothetical protein
LTFDNAQDKYFFPNFEAAGISKRQRNLHLSSTDYAGSTEINIQEFLYNFLNLCNSALRAVGFYPPACTPYGLEAEPEAKSADK